MRLLKYLSSILIGSLVSFHVATAEPITKLRVGFIPVGVYSYLWNAQDQGYFKDEGLEVELVPLAGGGEIIPAIVSGSLQFGISDVMGAINANLRNIDVKFVSFNFGESKEHADHTIVLSPKISDIKDIKTIATNLSYNTDWLMMRQWLRLHEINPDNVQIKEIPFPDMLSAVRRGTIDAAGMIEPFVTIAKAEGLKTAGNNFAEVKSPVTYTGVLASGRYLSENSGIAERFTKALNRSLRDYADYAKVKAVLAKRTKLDKKLIENMGMGEWNVSSGLADVSYWIELSKSEGLINRSMSPEQLIWSGSRR